MREDQNTEFKASWRDEHLKNVCAFANTKGGKLYLGISDDGQVIGFLISTYFAIGRFGNSDDDLRYQDIIQGNIFEMPDKVIEILRAKYLVSPIRYEGL